MIDGKIGVSAGGSAGSVEGWMVVITTSSSDAVADAAAALEAAGFTQDASIADVDASGRLYTNAEYVVVIGGEGGTVSYTVTPMTQ